MYRICTAPVQNIFTRAYTANIPEIISESEVAAIRKAADSLVGVHDFRSLSGVKKKKGTVKEIENDSFSLLTIKICANDFLYLMPEHIIEFLIKKGVDKEVRCNPAGLLLHSITYPDSCSVPSAGSKQV